MNDEPGKQIASAGVDHASSEVGPTRLGPIYIGDLNRQLIDSAQFLVTEDITLGVNGAATVTRRTEACTMSVPRAVYDGYMEKLRQHMPKVKMDPPCFEAGHRFVPTHLVGCSASTLDGDSLDVKEEREFGSTRIKVALPLDVEYEEDQVQMRLPGYLLHVELSRLARKIDSIWFLQWSHGAIGQTKLRINVSVPSLRSGPVSKLLRSQFFASEPPVYLCKVSYPLSAWIKDACRRMRPWRSSRRLEKNSGRERTRPAESATTDTPFDSPWPRLRPKTRTYTWQQSLGVADAMSIHVTYGTRYRKAIFSPLGFVLSNIVVIVLTIALTEPIRRTLAFIGDTLTVLLRRF